MNEQLVKDLEYLQRGTAAEGIEVREVTADEYIKNAEAQADVMKRAREHTGRMIQLGRAGEL